MERYMLDYLACPVDKAYPLEMYELVADDKDVESGALVCSTCFRYYPIIDSIPVMFPDNLRDKSKDLEFLDKWKNRLPDKIIKHGNPWHL